MLFEFDEKQLNNLVIFLNRVDLKGSQVPAYIEILNVLQNPAKKNNNMVPKSLELGE